MATPTEYLLNQLNPLYQGAKTVAPYINQGISAINQLNNPLSPAIMGAPVVVEGANQIGNVINNTYASDLLNDPLVRGVATSHPFTGLLLGASDVSRGINKLPGMGKKAKETQTKTEETQTKTETPKYKPRRQALEELYPNRYKDTSTITNGRGIVQQGRDFNRMAKDLFEPMEERLKKGGASEETLAAVSAMGSGEYNPKNLFSSINLPNATSQNSFEDPQIAISTGAIQPRNVDSNFMKGGTQFEAPNPDMPSVATTPGLKAPVEYTNYMRSSDPALGAMDALRMNDMQNDLIYASGQYFTRGADGNALMVDRDLAKQVKAGVEGASERLAKHVAQGGFEVPNAAEMAIRRAAAANAARMNG